MEGKTVMLDKHLEIQTRKKQTKTKHENLKNHKDNFWRADIDDPSECKTQIKRTERFQSEIQEPPGALHDPLWDVQQRL